MTFMRTRMRYLAAMGMVLPAVGGAACTEPRHMPSCPNGSFCVPEKEALASEETAASAPYAKCAESAPHPDDVNRDAGQREHVVHFSPEMTANERKKSATACCYSWVTPCPGGRAFRDATGTPSVARIVARQDWLHSVDGLDVDDLDEATRLSHAEHWMNEAAFEHASVASFAQLTLDLMAVGAPPELLEGSQRAGLDEIEHAKIAYALASRYGASAIGPAPLQARPGAHRTLVEIAQTTFIDACLGESVAAAALAESARDTEDPVLEALLTKMAEDEERHAELAWRIVAWALRSGDDAVATALAAARDEVIDELSALTAQAAAAEETSAGSTEQRLLLLRASVLRAVVIPCAVALLANAGASTPPRDARRYATS